jgi:hypothetical protein
MAATVVTGSGPVANKSTSSSVSLTMSAAPTSGNTLAVTDAAHGGNLSSISSTGNIFTAAQSTTNTGNQSFADGYYAPNCSTSTGITVYNPTNNVLAWAMEIQGVSLSSVLDQSGASATSLTTPSETPSQAGDCWVAVASNTVYSDTVTAPSSWTNAGSQNISFGGAGDTAYLNESGSGATSAAFQGTAATPCSIIMGFAPAPAPSYLPLARRSFVPISRAANY